MNSMKTSVSEAQRDMRAAYYGGAPGVAVSAAVWLLAGLVAWFASATYAVWTLLLGGMFIHPVALSVTKLAGRPGRHSAGNPLGSLALATTFWLVSSLPLAYAVSLARVEWFFPAMLVIIGGRYATFATVYGERTFWFCGASLILAAGALVWIDAGATVAAFAGAAIEGVFAAILFGAMRRESSPDDAAPPTPLRGPT